MGELPADLRTFMPYPLQQLLNVREHREETAALELLQRRQAVTAAQEHLQRCQQELNDYIQWRVQREIELYQEIMRKLIPLRELDDVKAKVQMLRAKEVTYQEHVLAAQRALEDARKAVHVAHVRYLSSVKN